MAKDGADNENEQATDEAPEAKSKKKLIIIMVVVLLLAVGSAKMFLLKPKPLSAAEAAAKQKTEATTLHDTCALANGLKTIGHGTTPTTTAAPEASKVLAPNDESVTVNLSDGAYLKVGIALQLDPSIDPKVAKDDGFGDHATDITLKELARHTMRGLAPPAARNRVQQQLSFDVCKAYDAKITNVYFTEFVMQAA